MDSSGYQQSELSVTDVSDHAAGNHNHISFG